MAYPEGGGLEGFKPPPLNLQKNLYCVFAKYILEALLLCSLNPKFYTGKRWKLYANFTFCFSFWGTLSPRPPVPAPHHVNPLHCKILGTPMIVPILMHVVMSHKLCDLFKKNNKQNFYLVLVSPVLLCRKVEAELVRHQRVQQLHTQNIKTSTKVLLACIIGLVF